MITPGENYGNLLKPDEWQSYRVSHTYLQGANALVNAELDKALWSTAPMYQVRDDGALPTGARYVFTRAGSSR